MSSEERPVGGGLPAGGLAAGGLAADWRRTGGGLAADWRLPAGGLAADWALYARRCAGAETYAPSASESELLEGRRRPAGWAHPNVCLRPRSLGWGDIAGCPMTRRVVDI